MQANPSLVPWNIKHGGLSDSTNCSGLINPFKTLRQRYENGCMVSVEGDGYRLYTGSQAESLKNELEKKITRQSSDDIIVGQTACQGYARSIAKVVLNQEDFDKFTEGLEAVIDFIKNSNVQPIEDVQEEKADTEVTEEKAENSEEKIAEEFTQVEFDDLNEK